MNITNNGGNELTIVGNIKTIEDSLEIKKAIEVLLQKGAKNIVMKIQDSFSMTSTVIGHLMKLVNIDKIPVSVQLGDQRLFQLLEDLSLVQTFNARLVVK
jgi:hypothetical protein